jgi:hypothetical protein
MLSTHETQLGNAAETMLKIAIADKMREMFGAVHDHVSYAQAVGYTQGLGAAIGILIAAAKEINGASEKAPEPFDVRKRYES